MFDAMDDNHDGYISYLEWSSGIKLSEINEMVRGCRHQGRLYQAALNEEEVQLYRIQTCIYFIARYVKDGREY